MTERRIELTSIQHLGIDTAPFIYFVERHALFGPVVRVFFERAERGELSLVTSTVTLAGVLTQPFAKKAESIAMAYRAILTTSPYIRLLPIDVATAEDAARLRAKYRLKTPDAIQLAVAMRSGCDAFLTNDGGLTRVQEIPVLVLSDLGEGEFRGGSSLQTVILKASPKAHFNKGADGQKVRRRRPGNDRRLRRQPLQSPANLSAPPQKLSTSRPSPWKVIRTASGTPGNPSKTPQNLSKARGSASKAVLTSSKTVSGASKRLSGGAKTLWSTCV